MTLLRENAASALRELFADLVWRHFVSDLRLEEPQVAEYVSDVLVDFTRADHLYRVRDALGRAIGDVGEMLLASNPLLEAESFDREREVRRHVGDFTLFLTGLFPESVARVRREKQLRLDAYVDFIKAGKESYAIVSSFDQFEYRDEAPLFRSLSDNFELCIFGLNLVRNDLQEFQREYYTRLSRTLEDTAAH